MIQISRFHKKGRIAYLKVSLFALFLAALFLPTLRPIRSVGNNIFTLTINGTTIGKIDSPDEADRLVNDARRIIAGENRDFVMIEADVDVVGEEVFRGRVDDPDEMTNKIVEVFREGVKHTMQRAYTVKIDEFMTTVSSVDDVVTLLEAPIRKYDTDGKFGVALQSDSTRELPVFVPVISKNVAEEEDSSSGFLVGNLLEDGGIYKAFNDVLGGVKLEKETTFEDYDYGIVDVSFSNKVEVVESYVHSNQIDDLASAIDEVTKDKEQKEIYEVVSGDTLSRISSKTGISIDQIIELNENITSQNSIIRIGDEITVTVPKPELSVHREELEYYEGTYEAPIQYVYNDSWYTTTEKTLQDPSSGYHKAVQKVVYLDGKALSRETIMEEIVAEAIPKIVEKGTKIPPTYIKPISGGRITSYFGGRTATIKGMTTNHGAIDWGVPLGTSVMASCGGTVTYAGWMSSYGYVVFINHPDGRQTRYAHLSRVLVSVGQSVSQGQKIALSGNTGVSTGPHLHFEMRINGKAVNPLNYISY